MDFRQAWGFMTGKVAKHPYPKHLQDARSIAADGIVLLKNENNLLPYQGKTVALFGAGAVDTIVCGTGSGYVMAPYVINIEQGLKNAGLTITSEGWLNKFAEESKKINKEDKSLSKLDRMWSGLSILIDEPEVTDEEMKEALGADLAIYVVRRNAGENNDRRAKKGDYYLSDMERSNLEKIAKAFPHTLVVLNTCVMDANFTQEIDGIDGALLLGLAGCEAGNALADVLTGKVAVSGHLTDTWAKKYEDNPASATFGSNDGNDQQEDYTEDIFVGYRYFDTFGIEPLYPFGFGLSYSSASYELVEMTADFEKVRLQVQVTNTGSLASKFVPQVYVTKPLGRLDQAYQDLFAFGKTKLLQPGESEIVTIEEKTETLASYDTEQAAFLMEAGSFLFRLGENSKATKIVAILNLDGEARLRQVSNHLSPDHELTCFLTPQECRDRVAKEVEEAKKEAVKEVSLFAADVRTEVFTSKPRVIRVSGKGDPNSTLIDVKEGRVSMKDFVDSLDEEVLYRLVAGAADETKHSVPKRTKEKYKPVGGATSSGSTTSLYADSLGIPNWKMTDGPAGCHLPFMGVTGWPVGMVIAQTWDPSLAQLSGTGIGKELEIYNFSIILGPGVNIHRDPLGGRNFEYYSEDPLLTGKMGAAYTRGVQATPGAGVSVKHFATNNQEEDRIHENNTVSERALREIYLRTFEIVVREADPKTIMTSYNCLNGPHTSSNYELLTDVLRNEWGFQGMVMTDWGSQSEKHLDLAAGNDLIMGGYRSEFLKAAVHGTPAEFAENGYVREQEFKVYGGFFKNVVEFWNCFKPDAEGPDVISTTVKAGVSLHEKIADKEKEGIATVTENADGSKTVSYKGYDRGAYLDLEDVKKCAERTLNQMMQSVSYNKMVENTKK